MARRKVQAQNLDAGRMLDLFNEELDAAARDIITRDRLADAREVLLKVKIVPEIQEIDGRGVTYPRYEYQVATKLPARRGGHTLGSVAEIGDGELGVVIDTDFPANTPRQRTFSELADEETA